MPSPTLDIRDQALLERARAVAAHAYSPYSGVRVGASLRTRSGALFVGCNVENASYGLTLCAERSALVMAVAEGQREFDALLVWSNRSPGLMPCGACRQMLAEFAPALRILVAGQDGSLVEHTLAHLLPAAPGAAHVRA